MSSTAIKTTTIRAPKRIDVCTASFLAQDLAAKILTTEAIVLDLSETQFIDAEGSNAILQGLLQAKQQQVKFALRGVHPQLKMILELGGVLKFFREK